MASFRSRIVRYFSGHYMRRVTPDRDVHELRAGLEYRGGLLPPAKNVKIQSVTINDIHCEWHVPAGCEDAPVIYYLHGGVYIMGSPATHRRLVSYIAREAGMRALVPDYRLAPENRFPAALEDSLGVYRQLLRDGLNASAMAIGGDSAGGNLAMATMLALREAGDELPAACILISPWLDMTNEGESRRSRASVDPWFNPAHVPASAAKMFSEFELRNPLVSPVFAEASGLPPTLIQVGDHEILLSDSTRMAENIRLAGGEVQLQVWPAMWHVFQFFIGQMPESRRAIADIGRFLRPIFSQCRIETRVSKVA
ncbi:MAG: alpha/beta hydrolase [Proteobacteria bacterium]|nr:alpha/beta hydrolase [Pseudomonadota bacterium]MDA0992666.1 alpha/beta hydrolase [Pseudomonadota bacterium]